MEYKVEDISPVKKKIQITTPPEEVEAALKAAIELYKKDAKLDGFRKGKVPSSVIEKRFHDSIYKNAQEDLVNVHINEILQKESLEPVSRLEMQGGEKGLQKGEPFQYTMEFEVIPSFDLPNYDGLEVTQEQTASSTDAIDGMLERLRQERARIVPVDGTEPAKDGQIVNLDFEIYEDGKLLENFGATNFDLELGNKQALKEFEALVKSIPVGHTGEGDVHFPDDFLAPELAGKTVKMKVTVHAVKKRDLPELNDEFAAIMQKKDMADLRQSLEKAYMETMTNLHKGVAQKQLLDSLVKQTDFELPPAMVNMETAFLINDWADRMDRQGKRVPEEELTQAKLTETFRPKGEERAREKILLLAVAKKENLEVDPKAVELEIYKNAIKLGENINKYFEKMRETGMIFQLRDSMLCDKAMDLIYERAKVTLSEPEELVKTQDNKTGQAQDNASATAESVGASHAEESEQDAK